MQKPVHVLLLYRKYWISFPLMVVILFAACAPRAAQPPQVSSSTKEPAAAAQHKPAAQAQTGQALLIEQAGTADTFQITIIDLQTGKLVNGVEPVALGSEMNYAFSPDRARLAMASKGAGCEAACLRIFRLRDLEEIARVDLPGVKYATDYVHQVVFDAQSARVAVAYGMEGENRVAVIDTAGEDARVVQDAAISVFSRLITFTAEGSQIMVIGHVLPEDSVTAGDTEPLLQAQLLNADSLRIVWQQDLPAVRNGFFGSGSHEKPEENVYYLSGIAADPARQRVYIAHADEDRLSTVDFIDKAVTTVAVRDSQGLFERVLEFVFTAGARTARAKAMNSYTRQVLLSRDGKTLYVVGEQNQMIQKSDTEWESVYKPLGLEAWELESGTRLAAIDTSASEIRWAPDGKILLNGYDRDSSGYQPYTEIYDPAAAQITARLNDTYAYTTPRLNGDLVLVSIFTQDQSRTFASVVDGKAMQPVSSWRVDGYAFWPEYR